MTYQLLLLRHAKSSHDVEFLSDHKRELNKRGRKAADSIAAYLKREDLKPDLVLCSSATRTRQTLEPILTIWPDLTVRYEDSLYLASVPDTLSILSQADLEKRVLVIGHHPTMGDTVHHLIDRSCQNNDRALADLSNKYPTAALAILVLDIESWNDVSRKCGQLTRFIKPRDLEDGTD